MLRFTFDRLIRRRWTENRVLFKTHSRSFLSTGFRRGPSTERVVYGLIAANAVVFVGWHTIDESFMLRHFTNSLENLRAGRIHTLITTAFSHYSILHMGTNLIALYFFGRPINQILLPKQVLKNNLIPLFEI